MLCIQCARDRLARRPESGVCDQCAAVNPEPLHVRAARAAEILHLADRARNHYDRDIKIAYKNTSNISVAAMRSWRKRHKQKRLVAAELAGIEPAVAVKAPKRPLVAPRRAGKPTTVPSGLRRSGKP